MPYLDFPITDTPEAATQRILLGLASRLPDWAPDGEGTLEVALAEEIGREISDLRALAASVAEATVRAFGQSLFGVAYLPGSPASISVRVSSTTQGTTIPAGFTAVGTTVDGVDVAFALEADSKMASNAASKTVTLVATQLGAVGNGVPVGPLRVATATPTITTVVAETAPSSGGIDAESDESYTNRLVATLSTLTRTPILPSDFAIRAKDVPGVYRAVALDGYDPDTGSTTAERTVTVVAVDQAGAAVGPSVRSAIVALLDGLRETNFVVKVASPTYTAVSVVFAAKALPGFDPATVQAAVVARALQILAPGTWAGGDEDPPVWRDQRTVYYLDLAAELDRVAGVDRITSLTINGAASDFTLPGPAGLPSNASTASGTVTA